MLTNSFTVKYRDPSTGQVVEGVFTTKKLSIRDRTQMMVKTTQYAGGMHCVRDEDGKPTGMGIDEETEFANRMLAHLEIALIQKPTWFNMDEIWDLGVVREVYQKVMDFESSFKSTLGGEPGPGGVGQASGSGTSPQANAGNGPTPVVGQKVSAALDA
jgi:hypothetical protein